MEHMGITLRKRKYSFNLIIEEFALINTKPSLPKIPYCEKCVYR